MQRDEELLLWLKMLDLAGKDLGETVPGRKGSEGTLPGLEQELENDSAGSIRA